MIIHQPLTPILVCNPALWIYTTSHDLVENTGWRMRDYNCLSTDDLVNWRDEGIVFTMDNVTWAHSAWAQQVIELPNGTYIMAFPGMGGSFDWSYPGGVRYCRSVITCVFTTALKWVACVFTTAGKWVACVFTTAVKWVVRTTRNLPTTYVRGPGCCNVFLIYIYI